MTKTTYAAKWGSDEIAVTADWAQASCPVEGDAHGRQVGDFCHRGEDALRAAIEDCARAEGLDLDDAETDEMIERAMASMRVAEHARVVDAGDLQRLTYHIRPRDQGQMVEIAYASDTDGERYVRRTTDRSDGSVRYATLAYEDAQGEYAPWNGLVPRGDWEEALRTLTTVTACVAR